MHAHSLFPPVTSAPFRLSRLPYLTPLRPLSIGYFPRAQMATERNNDMAIINREKLAPPNRAAGSEALPSAPRTLHREPGEIRYGHQAAATIIAWVKIRLSGGVVASGLCAWTPGRSGPVQLMDEPVSSQFPRPARGGGATRW